MRPELIDYIPHELALELKKLGFEEPCEYNGTLYLKSQKNKEDGYSGPFGWKKGELTIDHSYFINNYPKCDYSNEHYVCFGIPSWTQAFRWFRTKHDLHGTWTYSTTTKKDWVISINNKSINDARDEEYKTYDEAQVACLKEMIKLIKK